MEVNFLKFQTFLAKMYQVENAMRTDEGIWFSFRGRECLLFIWSRKNKRMRIPFWSETTIENLPIY